MCNVKKPIFLNTSDTWEYPDSALVKAKDLTIDHTVGRYRLTFKNSDVCEIWIDVDNHDGIPFKQYKQKRLIPALQRLNELGISNDYIFPKVSGTGVHLHVFVSELPTNIDVNDMFSKTTTKDVDQRSLVEKQRIREYGAIASTKKGYCGYISISELMKVRQLPTFKEPVYPEIKLFKATKEFLFQLSLVEADKEQEKIEKDVIVDYERDGDFTQLFKCPLIEKLDKKAKTEHHLRHNERLFLMCQFIHFGEESRKKLHEIISQCSDYDESLTQKFIHHAMNANYHPITCRWAKDMRLGCPADCKGSGGKSPIKFAWSPLNLEETKKTFTKWLCFEMSNGKLDTELLDIVFAIMKEREFQGDPIWAHIVAWSGGTKSEILRAVSAYKSVDIDSITSHTLISGKLITDPETGKQRPVKGLLASLDGMRLIIKDLTTILQIDAKERYLIFSQFRGAYDGYYAAAYGTWDKPIKLDVLFTILTGVTPAIDYHGNLSVILGERFFKIRHNIDRKKATKKAMQNAGKEKQMRKELKAVTLRFLSNLEVPEDVELEEKIFNKILHLALFVAQIRMAIPESSWRSALIGMTSDFETAPEYATRLSKQLLKLIKMLAIVRGRKKVTDEDYNTTVRVAFDTCPPTRLAIILYLYKHPQSTIEEISKKLHLKIDKTKRRLAELLSLEDVLQSDDLLSSYSTKYSITKTIKEYLQNSWSSVGESPISGLGDSVKLNTQNTFTTPISGHGKIMEIRDTSGSTENIAKLLYGNRVTPTSYLANRCMTCGRVPVGKNFELLHDAYAEIVIKMCRPCYIRFYYAHENSSSDRWTVIT